MLMMHCHQGNAKITQCMEPTLVECESKCNYFLPGKLPHRPEAILTEIFQNEIVPAYISAFIMIKNTERSALTTLCGVNRLIATEAALKDMGKVKATHNQAWIMCLIRGTYCISLYQWLSPAWYEWFVCVTRATNQMTTITGTFLFHRRRNYMLDDSDDR